MNERFAALFERPVHVFPLSSGTCSNAVALAAVANPYGAIYCHETAHINVYECGAPEFFTDPKLVGLPGSDCKLQPAALDEALALAGRDNPTRVQPFALNLTEPTDFGTLYSTDEVAALCAVAHRHGLRVHMDGARFANAVAALRCSPADLTWPQRRGRSTSYSPFQQYGYRLVFDDIDRRTLNYDLDKLHRACGKFQADCILAFNLLGNPNDYDSFPSGIPILEDNCEAMGAKYRGRRTGSFGVMGSHSTFFSHHICTMEGGMVTTDDRTYYEMLLSLRSHGWTRHLPEDNVLGAKVDKFHFILPGYNVRPTEMQCAIGSEQLKKLPAFVAQRRDDATRFPYPTQREIGESSWFGCAVFGKDKERVIGKYEHRPIVTGNFLRQPVLEHYNYEVFGDTPNADYIHDEGVFIGNSHERIEW